MASVSSERMITRDSAQLTASLSSPGVRTGATRFFSARMKSNTTTQSLME